MNETQHTHGGPRPGAGRKPRPDDGRASRLIRVYLNEDEYKLILSHTDPETRRELLLSAIPNHQPVGAG